MPGTVKRRCHCKNPETGKELGSACPALKQPKHGEWEYRDRLTTSTGRRSYRRGGFTRRADAEEYGRQVRNLTALAHGETRDLKRIGDYLFTVKRGTPLPPDDEVRRKLGLRGDLASALTVGEWLDMWLPGKRQLRQSVRETYESHIRIYLKPCLGDIVLDRLRPEHIDGMIDRIAEWNEEITEALAEGRRPNCEGDVRKRVQPISNSTLRRVMATLSSALGTAKKQRRIDDNVLEYVELPSVERHEAQVWGPDEVGQFLDFIYGHDDEMALLFQVVLYHGPRRGEIVGARWEGYDPETRVLAIRKTILSLSGRVTEGTPKTGAGERELHLDPYTAKLVEAVRVKQAMEKLRAGPIHEDNDLIFCRQDGSPWPPDLVSRRWRTAVKASGLPMIKLHEARHTAATLSLEVGEDIKVVSKRMGHSRTGFTQDRYQHVRRPVLDEASSKVADLVQRRRRKEQAAGGDVDRATG